ncbi:hypothetical protein [Vibrio splendidus]|uniref:hypothetical protein n=1 Tax=Vibrio splendidus TaxID=29497 RepID=UPI001C0783E4|nr:hypothetical protein [Vibrio splendidus]MBU2909464.1 hypothetical protein [Vibrio splendidus]MDO6529406.1 hypothetical protein [Vibrio splendidus]MDO6550461.1 hypothetical protein [Vibrio splendidus]
MDASGLLTVFAVLLTGATLLPTKRILDLKIRVTLLDKILFSVLIAFILYFLFFEILKYNNLVLPIPWLWGFDEESSLLASSLLLMTFCIVKYREEKLPKSSISKLKKEITSLIKEVNFVDISFLLEKYKLYLIKYYSHIPWYVVLHRKIKPRYEHVNLISFNVSEDNKTTFTENIRNKLACMIPNSSQVSNEIDSMFSLIFKSRSLVCYLNENHPTLGLELISTSDNIESVYREEFINMLLEDKHSLLYRELSQSQYIDQSNCYEIDASNLLLKYLFEDIRRSDDLKLYLSLNDFSINFIKKEYSQDSTYHDSCDGFVYSNERYKCPVYISIFLYDMMIRQAIKQNYHNHLFPNYLFFMAKEIISSIDNVKINRSEEEFPTRNYFLLYECFNTMSSWIDMIIERVKSPERYNPDLVLESFGMMTYYMLSSKAIRNKNKAYYLSVVLAVIRKLDEAKLSRYSEVVVTNSLKSHCSSKLDKDLIVKLDVFMKKDDWYLSSILNKYFINS